MRRVGVIRKEVLKKPVYRIDSIERMFEILEKKRLVFVRPSKWSDPLENIVFNASLIKNGEQFEHGGKKGIYAQCWTIERDSYALWQIYAKGGRGVRTASNFDKLKMLSPTNLGKLYVGQVQYLYKKDLDKLPKNRAFLKGIASDKISSQHIKTLLIKRKSYSYEKEIRLLSVPDRSMVDKYDNDLAHIRIDPTKFFTSFLFDPRLSYEEFMKYKNRLVGEFGFRKSQVKLSTLNQENRLKFQLS